mmetsp:Transcript_55059/g.62326  ORF Transcript_55059/g.62326 Transcript_55059/m.62326 type:complete len:81 (-) Transcript_55059:491-733(-)
MSGLQRRRQNQFVTRHNMPGTSTGISVLLSICATDNRCLEDITRLHVTIDCLLHFYLALRLMMQLHRTILYDSHITHVVH